ncbi:hypothetical protein [Luteipulveratus halotolerans]|uniref:Uncharacterized protein n=1 Tax=Luteipulveratus halotolerans TaxID=1631356 RepID=A0A0L6CKU4_9MICO|nr:hypothetical protein [Luteipulveratus halotolerans]KNX38416.1 hypothetical protein VV01_16720 [Luteipulveratus halotolerans]
MSGQPRGVIHDLGYRGFTGRRRTTGQVAGSLYATSLRHAFGLGRTGKSKVLPWLITLIMLVPALVLAGIIIQLNKMSLQDQADLFGPLSTYFGYPYWTQLLLTIFVAGQAPVLFARDLRYRTIVLYFARPLSRTVLVLVRLAALTTAVFAIIAVPLTIWYAVAMSSDMPRGQHTKAYLAAMVGSLVLALLLSALSAMVSSLTTRAGLSATGVIVVMMLLSGVTTAMMGAAYDQGSRTGGWIAAAFNPFSCVAGLVSGLFDQRTPIDVLPQPDSAGWTAFFALASLAWIVIPTLILLARTRKAASL